MFQWHHRQKQEKDQYKVTRPILQRSRTADAGRVVVTLQKWTEVAVLLQTSLNWSFLQEKGHSMKLDRKTFYTVDLKKSKKAKSDNSWLFTAWQTKVAFKSQ